MQQAKLDQHKQAVLELLDQSSSLALEIGALRAKLEQKRRQWNNVQTKLGRLGAQQQEGVRLVWDASERHRGECG